MANAPKVNPTFNPNHGGNFTLPPTAEDLEYLPAEHVGKALAHIKLTEGIDLAAKAQQASATGSRGMLVVTYYTDRDIELLEKRIALLDGLDVHYPGDLLLLSSHEVKEEQVKYVEGMHAPYFGKVMTHRTKVLSTTLPWPDSVNLAWRSTFKFVSGQTRPAFRWAPYRGWFFFEPDVLPLRKEAFQWLSDRYASGLTRDPRTNRLYCGYLNKTTASNGRLIHHLNGAAVYPTTMIREKTQSAYPALALRADGVPWDVIGLSDFRMPDVDGTRSTFDIQSYFSLSWVNSLSDAEYLHAFGTWDYRQGDDGTLVATQKFHDGKRQEWRGKLAGQYFLHGCKDGSLVRLLVGDDKVVAAAAPVPLPPELTLEEKILADQRRGLTWQQLIGKYRLSPPKLKAILNPKRPEKAPTAEDLLS